MGILRAGIRAQGSLIGDQVRRGLLGVSLFGPINTERPVISGVAMAGEALSCSTGAWLGAGEITFEYQWLRNGAPAAGATAASYMLTALDGGAVIACEVSASDENGSQDRPAEAVGPVRVRLAMSGGQHVALSGDAAGSYLEVSYG